MIEQPHQRPSFSINIDDVQTTGVLFDSGECSESRTERMTQDHAIDAAVSDDEQALPALIRQRRLAPTEDAVHEGTDGFAAEEARLPAHGMMKGIEKCG